MPVSCLLRKLNKKEFRKIEMELLRDKWINRQREKNRLRERERQKIGERLPLTMDLAGQKDTEAV